MHSAESIVRDSSDKRKIKNDLDQDNWKLFMPDYRVPKQSPDSWNALYDHLESIQEALEKGRSHNLRNLAGTMRLLIADKSKSGGLLMNLVIQESYYAPIAWVGHYYETLQSLLKADIRKILSMDVGITMTVEEFVRDEAQRSGSSHEDVKYQNILGRTLREKRSEGNDPYRGAIMSLGLVILVWGNEFYNRCAPIDLKRRVQVK